MILLWKLNFKQSEGKGLEFSLKSSGSNCSSFCFSTSVTVTPGRNRHRWRTLPSPNLTQPDSVGGEVISPADSTCPSSVSSQGWWISPLQWKLWCSHFKGEKQRKRNKLYFVFFVSSFHFHRYLCKRVHASDFGTCAHFSQSPNKCKITHIWTTWGETL